MTRPVSLALMAQSIASHLRLLTDQGILGFDCSPETLEILARGLAHNSLSTHGPLAQAQTEASSCTECALHKNREVGVFAQGDSKAEVMFVGLAPGREEARVGLPFQGEVGELLDNIIKAMGLNRESVYMCNLVKCPVADGQAPDPTCIRACSRFFKKQVEEVRPRIICALGQTVAESILKQELPFSRARGKFQPYLGMRVMPTHHPVELLVSPEKKRAVWQDMQAIMRVLDLQGSS
ncbi:MAG: uracil-DNA glycosylase [Desulfatibacillum sp.]|nr:uracil-DNA glycosylase [Desulfatibacillum sp.]